MIRRLPRIGRPQRVKGGPPGDRSVPAVSSDLLKALVDTSKDAVCCFDLSNGQITYANGSAEELFGFTSDDWGKLSALVDDEVKLPGSAFVETHVFHRSGRVISVRWRLVHVHQGTTAAVVFRASEVNQPIPRMEEDPLTGLPTRTVFESRLQESIEFRPTSFAAFFLDLDNFKEVNDRFGHVVGDRVLCGVAGRLVQSLRPVDTVARYGGDEFVALLVGIEEETSAIKAATRLLEHVAEPFSFAEHDIQIRASIGIVIGAAQRTDVAAVIDAADRAMYRAKCLGRNCYVVFDANSCPAFPAKLPAD